MSAPTIAPRIVPFTASREQPPHRVLQRRCGRPPSPSNRQDHLMDPLRDLAYLAAEAVLAAVIWAADLAYTLWEHLA